MDDNKRRIDVESSPARITTRHDFARELTRVREKVGLTVREVARVVNVPASTVGGYFGGAHLPKPGAPNVLERILRVCGVTDAVEVDQWREALRQARLANRRAGPRSSAGLPAGFAGAGNAAGTTLAGTVAATTMDATTMDATTVAGATGAGQDRPGRSRWTTVSTRPPVHRLAAEPQIRGREELLRLLANRHGGPPDDDGRVHVLHGVGGCGKSTVALALARDGLARGARTWWIPAADAGRADAGMRAVAVELGVRPEQLWLGSVPDQLWRRLDQLRRPWLLVIDNADDPQRTLALPGHRIVDATGWLRPVTGTFGTVVVTTRDASAATWGPPGSRWAVLHPVGPLTSRDGALVLRDLAGDAAGSVESARLLSQRLGGLPLALRAAGEFLRETAAIPAGIADGTEPATFDSYVRALDLGRHRELFGWDSPVPGRGGGADDRQVIGRTWELSLDLLETGGVPEARPMLRLLSCLGPGAIPYGLLRAGTLAGTPMFPGLTGRRMWTVLGALAGAGLVDLSREEGADVPAAHTLVVPALVRQTARGHRDVAHHLPRYLAAVTALLTAAVADLEPGDPGSWPRWRALAEHCRSPLELIREHRIPAVDTPPDVLVAAGRSAGYLRAAGHLSQAATRYLELITVGRRLLGDEHPQVLALRHGLGRVWYDAGQYDRAKRCLHAVAEVRARVLGPDHPDTLATAHRLARALRAHGQLDAAYGRFVDVLRRRRQVLGSDHLDTMSTAGQVADLLRGWGRLEQAGQILGEVATVRRRRLGPDHPATLVSRLRLARLAGDRGDHAAAEADLREVLAAFVATAGDEHPWTLSARQALADTCHRLGRLDEAARLVEQVLPARHQSLGYDHPATLASRHRLGAILQDRGDLDGAEKELRSVLDARRQALCPHHRDTVSTAARLASLHDARTGRTASNPNTSM